MNLSLFLKKLSCQKYGISLLVVSLLLTGCDHHEDKLKDLEVYVTNLKNKKPFIKKKQAEDQKIMLPVVIIYSAGSLREPFEGTAKLADKSNAAVNPLQAYPLNAFRFVGTATQGKVNVAYVLTPDKMIYQVNIGDVIGDHYGKIISISPNQLQIEEPKSEEGKVTSQVVTLQLKDDH